VADTAGLTQAQLRFAESHDVASVICPANRRRAGEVFMYRKDVWATYRWLVDPDGLELDAARFLKSPGPRDEPQ
jgi:hypothetical protein